MTGRRRDSSWPEGRLASVPPQESGDPAALFTVFLPGELCASPGQLGGRPGGAACFGSSGPDPALAPTPPPP